MKGKWKYDMGTFRPRNTRKHSTQFQNAQDWLSGKYEELARCSPLAKRVKNFFQNLPHNNAQLIHNI